MFVISTVFYLFIRLVGCSVSQNNSCVTRKLIQTPDYKKRKKNETIQHRVLEKAKEIERREKKIGRGKIRRKNLYQGVMSPETILKNLISFHLFCCSDLHVLETFIGSRYFFFLV